MGRCHKNCELRAAKCELYLRTASGKACDADAADLNGKTARMRQRNFTAECAGTAEKRFLRVLCDLRAENAGAFVPRMKGSIRATNVAVPKLSVHSSQLAVRSCSMVPPPDQPGYWRRSR